MPRVSVDQAAKIFRSPAKESYRNRVAKILIGQTLAENFRVAYLGGPESRDTNTFLTMGVPARNQYYIERGDDEFAMASAMDYMTGVNKYHDSAADSFEHIGRVYGAILSAANLDFCQPLSLKIFDEIGRVLMSGAFEQDFRFAITFSMARDGICCSFAEEFFSGDRFALLIYALENMTGFDICEIGRGEYQSNITPMGYVIFQMNQGVE